MRGTFALGLAAVLTVAASGAFAQTKIITGDLKVAKGTVEAIETSSRVAR